MDRLACVLLERYYRDLDKFHNREATGAFRAKERGFRLLSEVGSTRLAEREVAPLCSSWRLPNWSHAHVHEVFFCALLYCQQFCLGPQFVLRQAPTSVLLARALAN